MTVVITAAIAAAVAAAVVHAITQQTVIRSIPVVQMLHSHNGVYGSKLVPLINKPTSPRTS